MNTEIQDRFIKGIAFEKLIIRVLQLDNPNLKIEYRDYNEDNKIFTYDAFIADSINLNQFDKRIIHAEKIYVVIMYGRFNGGKIDELYKIIENNHSSHLIVFTWSRKGEENLKSIKDYSNLTIINREGMIHNKEIKKFFNSFENYISNEANIIFDDYYDELKKSLIIFHLH